MRRDLWIRMMCFSALLPACTCGKDDNKSAAPSFVPLDQTVADKNAMDMSATEYDTNVKPVYPANAPITPLVQRMCDALQTIPVVRRRDCCKSETGVMLTSECTRNLAGAVALDAVSLDEAKVAACEAAMTAEYAGCDWVGGINQPTPAACLGIIEGKLAKGAPCRSSLECSGSLRCQGSGPTDLGKCLEPLAQGRLCNTAVDALAAYTRQDDLEVRHPGCQGFCDRNRCYDAVAIGGECKVNGHCGRGNRCVSGKCVASEFAKLGETCLGGDCEAGLRCAGKICMVPKGAGETCANDFDCRASCVDNKCAMSCGGLPMILRPRTSTVTR